MIVSILPFLYINTKSIEPKHLMNGLPAEDPTDEGTTVECPVIRLFLAGQRSVEQNRK